MKPPRRVEYVKKEKGIRSRVVYELCSDGTERFRESRVGESRWYDFQPTPRELEYAWKKPAEGKSEVKPIRMEYARIKEGADLFPLFWDWLGWDESFAEEEPLNPGWQNLTAADLREDLPVGVYVVQDDPRRVGAYLIIVRPESFLRRLRKRVGKRWRKLTRQPEKKQWFQVPPTQREWEQRRRLRGLLAEREEEIARRCNYALGA